MMLKSMSFPLTIPNRISKGALDSSLRSSEFYSCVQFGIRRRFCALKQTTEMADQEQFDFNFIFTLSPACLNNTKSSVHNCAFCFVDMHHKLHLSQIASRLPSFALTFISQMIMKTQASRLTF